MTIPLKDHEIRELVNTVTKEVRNIMDIFDSPPQSLRERLRTIIVEYFSSLEEKQLTRMREQMGKCKDCRHWYSDRTECGYVEYTDELYGDIGDSSFAVGIRISDDTGLGWALRTGPEFGCIHFKEDIKNK